MTLLTPAIAQQKRQELLDLGYAVIPNVMPPKLVEELRAWSDALFDRMEVDPALRFQGSVIFVHAPRAWGEDRGEVSPTNFPDAWAERMIDLPQQREACEALGLEQVRADDVVIILSKPAHGPPLYWHQDYMKWHSPEAATPWPTRVFLSYYLADTTRANGCLRVIPGSHRKRHALHDLLPDAHGAEIQAVEDLSHAAFADYPDAADVCVNAGDLVITDARTLHAAWPNQSDQRRTLLLAWHDVFQFPQPPSWWEGEIPAAVREADPTEIYERSDAHRRPTGYLQ